MHVTMINVINSLRGFEPPLKMRLSRAGSVGVEKHQFAVPKGTNQWDPRLGLTTARRGCGAQAGCPWERW